MDFFARVGALQAERTTLLCLGLDPRPSFLTDEDHADARPLVHWGRRMLEAAAPYICCVKPNSAFYEANGAEGWEALSATIAAAHEMGLPVLLDAKRGDIGSTAEAYALAVFGQLGADAVTLSPYLGRDSADPFLRYAGRGLFLLCHTSNPGAGAFQTLEVNGRPLYEVVAAHASRWSPRVGLVVGANYPHAVERVREAAPHSWLLLPGVGAQGADPRPALTAGGERLLVPVSRAILGADDPAGAARALRDRLNGAREGVVTAPAGALPPPLARLADRLVEIGAIRLGEFTLKSGQSSPIYLDLRLLASEPRALAQAARAYHELIEQRAIPFDRLAALPYAALPIGTAVSLQSGSPLIYPRKESKEYGTARRIEGTFEPGERALILDDLVSTGGSKVEGAAPLRAAGLEVSDIVVLIDRSGGRAAGELAPHGLRLHAVMRLEQILDHLVAGGRIDDGARERVHAFLHAPS